MTEDETQNEGKDSGSTDESTDGPGNVTVDEPTDTSLEPDNDAPFRDGVPEPGQGSKESSET